MGRGANAEAVMALVTRLVVGGVFVYAGATKALDPAAFATHVAAGDFLEHATVHGFDYGTLKKPVYAAFAEGQCVLMDIDVEGAAQVRAHVATLPPTDPMRAGFVDIQFAEAATITKPSSRTGTTRQFSIFLLTATRE